MKHYNYGLRAEDRLSGAYRRRGYTTSYYPGSRGPADIVAIRGGARLYMQVRAVRSTTARVAHLDAALDVLFDRLSDDDIARLVDLAGDSGGIPVAALTNGNYYWTWRITATRDEHSFAALHQGWLPRLPLARESA